MFVGKGGGLPRSICQTAFRIRKCKIWNLVFIKTPLVPEYIPITMDHMELGLSYGKQTYETKRLKESDFMYSGNEKKSWQKMRLMTQLEHNISLRYCDQVILRFLRQEGLYPIYYQNNNNLVAVSTRMYDDCKYADLNQNISVDRINQLLERKKKNLHLTKHEYNQLKLHALNSFVASSYELEI